MLGDGRFLGLFPERFFLETRLLRPSLSENGAAVHSLDEPVAFQGIEIPAHGHLRHQEGLAQLGQADAPLELELLQDLVTPHAG